VTTWPASFGFKIGDEVEADVPRTDLWSRILWWLFKIRRREMRKFVVTALSD
jgi:hypothetical protein